MKSELQIRRATAADRSAFYDICLRTCDNGGDGSHLHDDPEMLGHIYVGPYLRLEPDFALALEDDDGVCGYCLATPDSTRFYRQFEHEWLPHIRQRLQRPSSQPPESAATQQLYRLLLNPVSLTFFPTAFRPWPAHLHIDLLPRAQGRGMGRELMLQQIAALRHHGASGIHVCVAPENTRAIGFYQKLGFSEMPGRDTWPEDTLYLGRNTN